MVVKKDALLRRANIKKILLAYLMINQRPQERIEGLALM